MIEWKRGQVRTALMGYPEDHTELGLASEHLGILKRSNGWDLLHQGTGLRITKASRQRDAKWIAERIVEDVARGGEPDELVARLRPVMVKWTRAGRVPWEEPLAADAVVWVPEASGEAPSLAKVAGHAEAPRAPVTLDALARWLDMMATPTSSSGFMRRWSLVRGRTRVEVALVGDEAVSSVCEALEAVAWAYRREVADVVRMVEEVAV